MLLCDRQVSLKSYYSKLKQHLVFHNTSRSCSRDTSYRTSSNT